MPTYRYGGDVEQVYPQYLDAAAGHTLHAQPGQTYDIAQAAGHTAPTGEVKDGISVMEAVVLPMPPDDRWTDVKTKTTKDEKKADS